MEGGEEKGGKTRKYEFGMGQTFHIYTVEQPISSHDVDSPGKRCHIFPPFRFVTKVKDICTYMRRDRTKEREDGEVM